MTVHGLKKQKGVATLFTAVVLLLVATILVFAVASSAIKSQKGLGNEVRIREAFEAAKAGLDYALMHLQGGNVEWAGNNAGDTGSLPVADAPANMSMGTGNDYGLTIQFTRMTDFDPVDERERPVFRISSTANPVAGFEEEITRSVSVLAIRAELGGPSLTSAGPLVVEGAMIDTKGTPQIVPGDNGAAVASLGGAGTEVDVDHANIHGGEVQVTVEESSLSETLFGMSESALDSYMYQLSQNPDFSGRVHYFDDPSVNVTSYPAGFVQPDDINNYNLDDGSIQHIVYFSQSAGCPSLNNANVIGMVYYAYKNPETGQGCNLQGWGNCFVYGTVAISGSAHQMNANCQIVSLSIDELVGEIDESFAVLSPVPGTWNDY